MSPKDLKHFLVVFDVRRAHAEVEEFDSDYDAAIQAYDERESQFRDHPDIEVVLLSSDSIESVYRTHGSYFEGSDRHLDDIVARELEEEEFPATDEAEAIR
jgi:hypothetical protein